MNTSSLDILIQIFKNTTAPRGPRGIGHTYYGVLILVFLGLLARLPYLAHGRSPT